MALIHATVLCDDKGIRCAYCKDHGWMAMEAHCANCGECDADCECDEDEQEWRAEEPLCGCLAHLDTHDCDKCGECYFGVKNAPCPHCPKPEEPKDYYLFSVRINKQNKLFASYYEAMRHCPVGAAVDMVPTNKETWRWVLQRQRK